MGTSKPTFNTMGVQNRFCETPKNVYHFVFVSVSYSHAFIATWKTPPPLLSRIAMI
jgi:hypothetical protein